MRASDCNRREGDDPWELQGMKLSQPRPAGTENWVKCWRSHLALFLQLPFLTSVSPTLFRLQSLPFLFPLQLSLTSLEGKMSEDRRLFLYPNAHRENRVCLGIPHQELTPEAKLMLGHLLKISDPTHHAQETVMGQRLSETPALFIYLRSLWFLPSLPLLFPWQWCLCRTNSMCHPPSSSLSGKFMLNFPSACTWYL